MPFPLVQIRYKRPRVEILLPKIREGAVNDIDIILERIRALGVIVTCSKNIPSPPNIEDALDKIVIDEFSTFTNTLNIDCTILLALVSDISHSQVVEAPWFNAAVRRQLEMEAKEKLLPFILWPAIRGRRLVCTREAAKRMREIVDNIGTESERARTRILMGDDKSKLQVDLIRDFQAFSEHQLPVSEFEILLLVEQLFKRRKT
jgi:hypothetical protein